MTKEHELDTNDSSVRPVLKMGWSGLNKMLGRAAGVWPGEIVCFAGRNHSHKTGMLMRIPRWIREYHQPVQIDGKKPLILMVLLEGNLHLNVRRMAKQLYIHLSGVVPPTDADEEAMISDFFDYFGSTYTLVIHKSDPETLGYDEYVALVEKHEASGHYIVASIVDHLELMRRPIGTDTQGDGHEARGELYRKMGEYHRSICVPLFTSQPLDHKVPKTVASDSPHLLGGVAVEREVDVLIYLDVDVDDRGILWLTAELGKSRYREVLEGDKFFSYPIDPGLGIADDVEG